MRTWIVFSLMATVAAACSPASESASDTAAPVNVAAAPLADSLLAMTV